MPSKRLPSKADQLRLVETDSPIDTRPLSRRESMHAGAAAGLAAALMTTAGCRDRGASLETPPGALASNSRVSGHNAAPLANHPRDPRDNPQQRKRHAMAPPSSKSAPATIQKIEKMGFPWPTRDPFLACMHHDDRYPAGNAQLGPSASLQGRDIGQDFAGKDGWRMYHGEVTPGFPQHPHRGFETVTIVRTGLVDHSDSMGATARYGQGDVQWLTAGGGIQHAEMFPLVNSSAENPLELFQLWVNLPASKKMVEPHFTMLWGNTIPQVVVPTPGGGATHATVIAGTVSGVAGEVVAPSPPPNSWASQPDADVAIVTLRLEPRAQFTLPAAQQLNANRSLYFFRGSGLRVNDTAVAAYHHVDFRGGGTLHIENTGADDCELLMLQGRPIAEPVARYGPFVMNTRDEIQAAFSDYQKTQFGGWPWPRTDPVHSKEAGRFAQRPDGRIERPPAQGQKG